MIERTCLHCGTTFKVKPSQLRQRACLYCSKSCKSLAHWAHTTFTWTPVIARFWSYVDKTSSPQGCWLWKGPRDKRGYGWFKFCLHRKQRQSFSAHRFAYELHQGTLLLPTLALHVCHDCPGGDNPGCVNPTHLFLGTAYDNAQDAKAKGQIPVGSRRLKTSLTEAQVYQILARQGTDTAPTVAKDFHVGKYLIYHIWHRRSWTHVRYP